MTMKLYDLCGADDLRFSPFCWRTKLALAHKGLSADTIPCKFTEIPERVAFAQHDRVPVLVDGDRTIADSWRIAQYLEDSYPDRPSLFGGEAGRGLARFFNSWADSVFAPAVGPLLVPDVLEVLHEDDAGYFRESREKRFGVTIESLRGRRTEFEERLGTVLGPLRMTLTAQPYVSGETPLYPDYIIFGPVMWGRCASDVDILLGDDNLHAWRDRMLDLFDGLGRLAQCRAA